LAADAYDKNGEGYVGTVVPPKESMPMDIADSINIVENEIRDLIELVLRRSHGDEWFDHLGVTAERVSVWQQRRDEEPKKRPGGEVDSRLLYYADFYDAVDIVRHNWEFGFKDCFEDKRRFEVYTDRLGAFRNPDAHSRALLPFEQHLVLGMTGELRQMVTLFLSRGGGGPEPEHFARIEEVRDNFGLRVTGGSPGFAESPLTLRPGDVVTFTGQAWDPESSPIEWRIMCGARVETVYENGNQLDWTWEIDERDIGDRSAIVMYISTARAYKRTNDGDDRVVLSYRVLPRRAQS
jgi:hypothetical protein